MTKQTRPWASPAPALRALGGGMLCTLLVLSGCGPGNTSTTDGGRDAVADGTTGGDSAVACTDPTQSRCGASCASLQSDPMNCGACGNVCATGANGTARCVSGVCRAMCAAGFADCDNNAANGCEANLATAASSCGACGVSCGAAPNSTPRCADATCGLECATGYADCDGANETGCETHVEDDREHCGMCGRACPWPARSDFSCASLECRYECRRNYADCDRAAANGCEVALINARNCGACGTVCSGTNRLCAVVGASPACVDRCPPGTMECDGACVDTQTNTENCGACGMACAGGPNAQAACVTGRCGLECRPGYADCDGNAANGCEVNLALNAEHCGSCGNRCSGGAGGEGYCAGGACRVRCRPGALDCDGNRATGCEVDPASDIRHCGGCGRACAAPRNAAALCNVGSCEFACDPGFGNCDANAANGCETVLRSDPANCGACGFRCADGQSCIEGACVGAGCMPGRGECDGNTATVCETDLYTSTEHCGACGSVCARANAVATCAGGGCSFEACLPGFGNCDNNRLNGCETDVTTPTNCGACGVVCSFANAAATCAMGACGMGACAAGFADCDRNAANGCEASLMNSAANCGACGNACVAGQSCMNGMCAGVIAPPMDGGTTPTDGGGPDATSPDGAGMDGSTTTGDGASAGDGSMMTGDGAACVAGQTRCGAGMAAACTDTQTDPQNCGACGTTCMGSQTCVAGACVCATGSTMCGAACTNVQTDSSNCGMCGRACPTGQTCSAGACACPAGQTLCGGACVDGNTDPSNCGMCGRACGTGQMCTAGACTCAMGQTACGTGATATCVNTDNDAANCGACAMACPAGRSCSMGACVCPMGQTSCGTGPTATCVNAQTDNENCGACGTACTGGSSCVAGACACPMGETRCGTGATAACTNTGTDTANCGACGTACPSGQVCNGGMCQVDCTAPRMRCGTGAAMVCTDTSNDDRNCGACGTACNGVPNSTLSLCSTGRCIALCESGFGNCDGTYSNGCEANTTNDEGNCGACGTRCPLTVPNAASVQCLASTCRAVCAADTSTERRRDCNGDVDDGCEANLLSDRNNCGACGNACGAGVDCYAGLCAQRSCAALHTANPSLPSGEYDIDPDGTGPVTAFRAYCDMVTEGGGWTLISTVHNGDRAGNDVRRWNSLEVFTNNTTFGSIANRTTDDFKSPAFSTVGGSDFLVVTDEYYFGFRGLFGGANFASYVSAGWPAACNTRWAHSGADFGSTNLTDDQRRTFGFTLRGLDNNSNCFPGQNEQVAISLQAATCCWVNGLGNTPNGFPAWSTHDLSLPMRRLLIPQACTAGVYPCNALGFVQNSGGQTYDRTGKVSYAMTFIR